MDELTQNLESKQAAPLAAPSAMDRWDTKMRTFRVRVIRFDRPESKNLTLRANSESAARAQAQSRMGRDWRIARIQAG